MALRATRGRQYRRNREIVLRGSRTCHVCGHDGADATDHVIPVAKGGTDALSNLRPIHHAVPCPTCGVQCNYVKRDRDWAPVVRHSGSFVTPGEAPSASPQRTPSGTGPISPCGFSTPPQVA